MLSISKRYYTKKDWDEEEKEELIMMIAIMTPIFAAIVFLAVLGVKLCLTS